MSDCAIEEVVEPMAAVWQRLLRPLLVHLDMMLDRRLVATFSDAVRAIVQHLHRNHGLLLSELGAYLLSPAQAPAGTKRLSKLLRSSKWCAQDVAKHLWQHATTQVQAWHSAGEEVLALWDESILEKPESQVAQGLSPVRSSRAARLSRIKPGYSRPPGAPVFVPGLNWMALLFIGRSGSPCVAAMTWWGTRSTSASASTHEPWLQERRAVKSKLLQQCQQAFGRQLLHIFDRGFAGAALPARRGWKSCISKKLALCCAGPSTTSCATGKAMNTEPGSIREVGARGNTSCCRMPKGAK